MTLEVMLESGQLRSALSTHGRGVESMEARLQGQQRRPRLCHSHASQLLTGGLLSRVVAGGMCLRNNTS